MLAKNVVATARQPTHATHHRVAEDPATKGHAGKTARAVLRFDAAAVGSAVVGRVEDVHQPCAGARIGRERETSSSSLPRPEECPSRCVRTCGKSATTRRIVDLCCCSLKAPCFARHRPATGAVLLEFLNRAPII